MPNTYGVTPEHVAAQLKGLFPSGFSVGSSVSTAQVQSFIDTADAIVTLKVEDVTGVAPQVADKAALLAKEFVVARATARVLAVLFMGQDPNPAVGYFAAATELLNGIAALGEQAVGTGAVASTLGINMPTDRELLICDADLDGGVNRVRRF